MRKKTALLLSAALLAGMVAGNGNDMGTVHAAGTTPSVTTFATKDKLQKTFDCNGENDTVGLLRFGKNMDGEPQTWYIVGTDSGVTGENIVLFAAEPIFGKSTSDGSTIEGQVFKTPTDDQRPYEAGWNCQYSGNLPLQVNRNHYGGSDLRAKLQEIAESEKYFTEAEQSLMNATRVETFDTLNEVTYFTTDRLYALSIKDVKKCYIGEKLQENGITDKIYAGSNNEIEISCKEYGGKQKNGYWLRSPLGHVQSAGVGISEQLYFLNVAIVTLRGVITYTASGSKCLVKPAANLDLTNVLFASAAKAASQEPVSEVIASETPMVLRLNEKAYGKTIGTVEYDENQELIVAQKDKDATGTVSLVVQGNDGTSDWYYSVIVDGSAVVTKAQIQKALNLSTVTFADCRIWLETTEDNVAYATELAAERTQTQQPITKITVSEVELTGVKPVGGTKLAANASCATVGIGESKPALSYTTGSGEAVAVATGIAGWDTEYSANITLRTAVDGNQAYVFADQVAVTVDGENLGNFVPDEYGRLSVTQDYRTDKRKIAGVAAPAGPSGEVFSNYYTAADVLTNGRNSELGTQADVTLEGTTDVAVEKLSMDVEWTLDGGAAYDATPGAVNTFRWTVKQDAYQEYDTNSHAMTGTYVITNRAATPVNITGTDGSLRFNGTDIDVSGYFTLDPNAGTAAWSLEPGGTGVGTLNGTTLTVTRTGTFLIKVSTAANGIYAAGEKTITLTVSEGGIVSEATDYSGIYDGQSHRITVNVTEPSGAVVTYSTDGGNFVAENPGFTKAGSHEVEYKIEKEGYTTVTGKKTVTITKRNIEIKAEDQTVLWGTAVDPAKYTVSTVLGKGLAAGDSIAGITLTPSTSERTENGTLTVGSVKIVNATGEDVTDCYSVSTVPGILKIVHNTALAPDRIEAVKTKTAYEEGDSLNLEDLTVTAYYADGYSETVTGYTTNASDINMSVPGTKILTVSFTQNGVTRTGDIVLTVNEVPDKDIVSEATDYSGIYDGQSHSIKVSVTEPSDAVVTYSTDGGNFVSENPGFTKAGSYAVEYKIEKEGYTTVTGKKTVTITKRNIEIKAEDQTVLWGTAVDPAKYTVSTVLGKGLAAGDSIAGITLTPSTSERTENGTLTVGSVKIVNATGEDVTDCYSVLTVPGILKIVHNTALAPDRIEAVKNKTAYEEGNPLNLEDLTVTAYYADGYSETVTGYTTNASDINMSVPGTKILTVSFTQNGVTRTGDIVLTVKEAPDDDDSDDNDSDIASNNNPQTTPQPVQPVTPRRTASPASAGSKEYKVMEGADSAFRIGEDESLTIRVDAELGRFTGVEIDGREVDPANYTTWSGSTYVKFTKEFLNELALGGHTVKILFSDGYAITTISITKNEQQDSVKATPAPTTAPSEETTIPAGNTDTTASQTAESTTSAMPYAAVAMIVIIVICGAALVIVCVMRRKEDN